MTDVADKLREARKLIERGWTQGYSARTDDDRRTIETDPAAASWCSLGAISLVHDAHWSPQYYAAVGCLKRATNQADIVWWNDNPNRTKAHVLAAFDRAIALAEQTA